MRILDEKELAGRKIPMTPEQRLNMERCAEFMARMIMKYGKKVLAEIEAEEKAKAQEFNT